MIAVLDKAPITFDEFMDSNDMGYEPDIVVLDETAIADEPRWERESVVGQSIKLAVEIVSTNWRDDYLLKLADYEAFGIQEY